MSGKSFGPDWQPDEPLILEEVGIIYSFDAVDGWTSYSYSAIYKDLTIHSRRVYTSSRKDFLALLAHWNKDDKWRYAE